MLVRSSIYSLILTLLVCMLLAPYAFPVDIHSLPPAADIASLPEDGGPEFNRLIFEKSPYLLQHARNPVNWYPWGDAAFERAREEHKLVFLSIGYSTCHWCHVMARESFEDPEVAALLDAGFVAVKVDREERPDIDEIYMAVTQAMTGSGGWPMTVILTPDRKPVFAGTYFPKSEQFGRPGLLNLLPKITEAYKKEPEKFLQSADQITAFLKQQGTSNPGEVVPPQVLNQAFTEHVETYDAERGGFGLAPKFPTPHRLMFLLRHWKRTGDGNALKMVESTLSAMRLGGIFDHIGHGFHRYSVDAEWLVPHFEKMLYDQALLAMAYTEAWQATGNPEYEETVRATLSYVLRDLTAPAGGFYSAEDADSEGEEGKFYVWTRQEILDVLGDELGGLYGRIFNIQETGNWEEGEAHKTNIPHRVASWAVLAEQEGLSEAVLRAQLETARSLLFEQREKRVHPHKDDKILTDWNGLMIAALAKAGRALNAPEYTDAATRAADFILSTMRNSEGRLHHRYRDGHAGLPAQQEDYAFLIWGLIELYQCTFEASYLKEAIQLTETMHEHYWDEEEGGYFMTADDAEALIVRPRTVYDGAIPSGNSVAAHNLIRLARLTGNTSLEERAGKIFNTFGGDLEVNPSNHALMLLALDFAEGPANEVVIAGEVAAADTTAMLNALRKPFLPNTVVVFRPEQESPPSITGLAPYTLAQTAQDGRATAYVCQNFVCNFPTTNIDEMMKLLNRESESHD